MPLLLLLLLLAAARAGLPTSSTPAIGLGWCIISRCSAAASVCCCAVNLGSSGGPLLDSAGRVIGINTALFRPGAATGSVGVSFALPINTARRVVGDLVAKGRVQRASLGVQPATEVVARAFNITSGGVLVQAVDPGSPADTAGLLGNRRGLRGVLVGDVIVAVDGRKIATLFDLSSLLDSCAPGQSVEVTAVRNIGSTEEERVTVTAVLEAEK